MSSYTSRIRLEKQIPGQNENTWGTVLNDNVIDLVDDSIAAYTTITVSSVAVTLTQSDGASDQARSAFLDISGTLTSNVNVIIPALSKGYDVRNSTSGSFTVNMKTATGSGQIIPQGQSIGVVCDGVSVRDPHQTWLMYLWEPPNLTSKSPWQSQELFLSRVALLYLALSPLVVALL
jgi:hypothetical protein